MLTLKADIRDPKVNLADLRKSGKMPAVFYGLKKTSTAISLSQSAFQKAWKEAGESTAISLETPNGTLDVMIHDVNIDPMKGRPIHADFLVIDTSKAIEVGVPLEFVGISEPVKNGSGILVKVMHELEISALPKDLPHSIEIDISVMGAINDQITVEDIKLPHGVTAITKLTEVVALISEAKEEKEEDVAPVDLSAIEVEKKGKKEEDAVPEDDKKAS